MLALEDVYGDLWFSLRDNQVMELCWVMLSLDVSRCARGIDQTNVTTTNKCVWDLSKRNVFETVASCGAGDLLFTIHLAQRQSAVCLCSMV